MKDLIYFLLVDDQQLILTLASRILKNNGYKNIIQAKNGTDALNKIKQSPMINVIVTDWNMPIMNGIELLMAIRRDPNYFNISVLMLAEEMSDDKILYVIEEGVDAYMEKPFSEDKFIANINKVLQKDLDPDPIKYKLQKLTALSLRKKVNEVVDYGKSLLKEYGNNIDIYLILGDCYLSTRDYDKAEECLNKALKINEKSSKAYYMLGQISMKQFEYEKALSYMEKAYSINPLNTDAVISIGNIYLKMGKIKEASETFSNLQVDTLTNRNYTSIGAAYLGAGNLEKAGQYLQSAKAPVLESIAVFNKYALELKKQGEYEAAIDQYQKCLRTDPANHILLLNTAVCYFEKKNYAEATTLLEKCLGIEPNFNDAARLLNHIKKVKR